MSAGVDAMGVAVRLTPALFVLMAVGLAGPAVGQPADPAQAPRVELIDPDCDPEEAERADPVLVEESNGICPPDEAERPGDGPGAPDPPHAPGPDPSPGPPPDTTPLSPPPAPEPPQGLDRSPAGPGLSPVTEPDRALPKRRPPRTSPPERRARERSGEGPRRTTSERERRPSHRPKSVRRREARRPAKTHRHRDHLRHAPGGPAQEPLTRFPVGSQEALPDPLPPARRLDAAFAKRLERIADRSKIRWELMLAVLRARGHDGAVPADRAHLRALARRLVALGARKHPRRAVRRLARVTDAFSAELEPPLLTRRTRFVKRVIALAHYNKAVGLRGLVRGLKRVRKRLARLVLESRRVLIYPGGHADIKSGFTDVRVLVLLRYLASRHREVTVTSLTTGHGFLTASGNVSLHSHGRAVDIAALNGTPILGHQEPGGLTERALRSILLLPVELEPSELISLFELGGASFALADHADHIHVGF